MRGWGRGGDRRGGGVEGGGEDSVVEVLKKWLTLDML